MSTNPVIENYKLCDYIGDGVYIGLDDQNILWMFTYNGIEITNKICLDSDTLDSFLYSIRKYGYK